MDTARLVAVPPAPKAAAIGVRRLAVAHIGVAVAAFGVASAMAMMQALSRANLELPFRSASMYYMSVTGHGTLMALVFTTFFIMAFGYVVAERALGRAVPYQRLAWASGWRSPARWPPSLRSWRSRQRCSIPSTHRSRPIQPSTSA
jgi:hypothetical protein